jgi:pyruvate dehydrogenase E2 component (dihydrolipoamide acetyltransferase)
VSQQTLLLPDLGEGLTEAAIVHWLVDEGDEVRLDQPVVEVETAKAVVEVPTPYAGRVVGLHGREGETLSVGAPLISFDSGEAETKPEPKPSDSREHGGSGSVLVGSGTSPTSAGRRLRPRPTATAAAPQPAAAAPLVSSPVVRALARERGVDVRAVNGTGPGGAVTRGDVERAAADTGPTTSDGWRRVPLTGFGRAASANFTQSRSEIPEATIWVDVDATPLVELRESGRAPDDPGPGLLAFLAAFVVAGLREYPTFNGRFDAARHEIVESNDVNLGIAAQGDRGLVVPVVQAAQNLSLSALDRAINDAAGRAAQGKVSPSELAAGTFTLNNYGRFGVDGSAAIINYPQVAILGIGRIMDRPWVVRGEIKVRKIAQLSFVFDHRICDGATAAGFVRTVADAIENPVRALARR